MELLGQGSNLSHGHDLSHSCSNARSLTHCARLGIKPASQRSQKTQLCRGGNSKSFSNKINKINPMYHLQVEPAHLDLLGFGVSPGGRNPPVLLGYQVCRFIDGEGVWVRIQCPQFNACFIHTRSFIYLSGLQALHL